MKGLDEMRQSNDGAESLPVIIGTFCIGVMRFASSTMGNLDKAEASLKSCWIFPTANPYALRTSLYTETKTRTNETE